MKNKEIILLSLETFSLLKISMYQLKIMETTCRQVEEQDNTYITTSLYIFQNKYHII